MALLISFLIGIQLFHAVASVPLPHFLSPSCNSLGVNIAAEEALNKHNKYRTEGYVLGLQRIFDAQEVSENDESVYNLILDVLETDCHVRSRKSWKECKFRHPHETVFGHCEIIIRLNRKTNDSFLHRNNCILRPLSTPPCPGCPVRKNPSEDSLQEAAKESLAKFNAENGHNHYFALVEVVAGISKTVEFIIQETSCHKSTPVSDLSQCSLLSSQTAEAGLCKGSVLDRGIKLQKTVSVNCEFFPHPELHHPQHSVNATEIPANQKETGGQVIDYLPVSKPDVAELKEPHPTVPGLGEETTSTIPPYPKGLAPVAVFSDSSNVSKMSLLISFFIGVQMLHSVVTSPPFRFLPPTCNSLEVKAAAEMALNKLNAHRKEGYVLGLQRIFDVRELPQWMGGSLFYITLDVLETECHVQSRNLWKECKIREAHETVYGQCKIIIHFNRNSNHSQLYSYDCVLRSPESLAKFNAESNHVHYFTVLNVTKARSQWVVGPSNFVEYTIQETSCPKSQPVSVITKCPLLPSNTAEAGLCKGSVVNSRIENRKFVTVKCHFFPHLPLVTDEQTPLSGLEPGQEEHHDDGKRHRNHHEENRHHHHHSHAHHHKHHGHKHEDQEPHSPHRSANITEILPDQKEILGRVIIYPPSSKHVSLHSLPEVQEPKPTSKPSLTSPEQEASPHSVKLVRPAIPPFPNGFSESPSCPGDLAIQVYGLHLHGPELH
ncbi:hypothetical protein Chor_014453 [Crotalus horridus]